MSETNKKTTTSPEKKSGSAMPFLVLGVLIVAAIAALAFVSNTVIAEPDNSDAAAQNQVAAAAGGEEAPESHTFDPKDGPQEEIKVGDMVIKPGDPVVAKIGDEEIKRSDVFNFIAQLPPQMRQQPIGTLFPLALEQTINAYILENRAQAEGIENNEQVQAQIEDAKRNIMRTAYVQQVVEEGISDAEIQKRYDEYIKELPEVEETKARHILVDSEDKAKELIAQLKDGADFAELAKENSTGPTAPNGGDLGYFSKDQMVPEFSDAAFATEPGNVVENPIQTQFGWHVIKVEDRRVRPKPELDEIRPLIETEIKRDVLDEKLQAWRGEKAIQTYDINGEEAAVQPEAETGNQEG
jgi:peptidyl-prolyl cis-trans isomerase C